MSGMQAVHWCVLLLCICAAVTEAFANTTLRPFTGWTQIDEALKHSSVARARSLLFEKGVPGAKSMNVHEVIKGYANMAASDLRERCGASIGQNLGEMLELLPHDFQAFQVPSSQLAGVRTELGEDSSWTFLKTRRRRDLVFRTKPRSHSKPDKSNPKNDNPIIRR